MPPPNQPNRVADLYHQHQRDLVRFFAGRFADRAACEDLCQDVFLRLLLAEAAGTLPEKPQAWLKRVARNLLVDTYRRRAVAEAHQMPRGDKADARLIDLTV
ncbi:MAG: RNA polymerase sigma factor, partial [Thermomicrobiales bacterium]